jgi:3-oxoacid CoA-transferase subunit B
MPPKPGLRKSSSGAGLGVVDTIVTELAFIRVTPEGMLIEEIAPGVTVEEVQKLTEPVLIVRQPVKIMA